MLCDDAGLGKSATVLDAADKLGLKRVLCVGPAVSGVSWPLQLRLWSPNRVFVNLDLGLTFGFSLPGFYFVSFDVLSSKKHLDLVSELIKCPVWDCLVVDEGQYLKTPHANRTVAVYGTTGAGGIAANTSRAWVLSGTLAPNHAGETYTHLRRFFGDQLKTLPSFGGRVPEQYEFEGRYCRVRDGIYGRAISGSQRMGELRQAIAPVLLRRRKAEVLRELPPIAWLEAPIALDPTIVREIYESELQTAHALSYDGAMALPDDELMARLTGPGVLSTQRRLLGLAKVPGCIAWLIDRLEGGEEKLIVFAHHRNVLHALRAGLLEYGPVLYDGQTSAADRPEIVRRFQTDARTRVFIGQLVAAGTSITLTAAKTVLMAEFASTPGTNYQAASRPHRIGQQDGVQVYFAMVPDSLDEKIAATARRRAYETSQLFD